MSDVDEDLLQTRLEDLLTVEGKSPHQEEAVPFKCFGRGGKRPPLAKLNIKRFVEVCRRNNSITSDKLMIPIEKGDAIINDISSNFHELSGDARNDRNITEWLKESFSEVVGHKKQTDENLQEALYQDYNFVNNSNIQLRSSDIEISRTRIRTSNNDDGILYMANKANGTDMNNEDMSHLSVWSTTDHESSTSMHDIPSSNSFSSVDKRCYNETPASGTSHDKSLRCTLNKSHTFTIENLPRNITQNELRNVLDSFGTVENIVIRESVEGMIACVRMERDCSCSWIIECLNGTQPFGASPHLIS